MEKFQLNGNESKYDPLRINWNKENDMTVLYGPQLSDDCLAATQLVPKNLHSEVLSVEVDSDLDSYNYSSSPTNSDASSIFESNKPILIKNGNSSMAKDSQVKKNLRFSDSVRTREIDHWGVVYDGMSTINDTWSNEMIMRQDCFILNVDDCDDDNDYEMEL